MNGNCSCPTNAPGADAPKSSTPMFAPWNPVYFIQPKVEPASTDTRAVTEGGSTESLHRIRPAASIRLQEICKNCLSCMHTPGSFSTEVLMTYLYSCGCSSNSSQQGIDTTRTFFPSSDNTLPAFTASSSSLPVPGRACVYEAC